MKGTILCALCFISKITCGIINKLGSKQLIYMYTHTHTHIYQLWVNCKLNLIVKSQKVSQIKFNLLAKSQIANLALNLKSYWLKYYISFKSQYTIMYNITQ